MRLSVLTIPRECNLRAVRPDRTADRLDGYLMAHGAIQCFRHRQQHSQCPCPGPCPGEPAAPSSPAIVKNQYSQPAPRSRRGACAGIARIVQRPYRRSMRHFDRPCAPDAVTSRVRRYQWRGISAFACEPPCDQECRRSAAATG